MLAVSRDQPYTSSITKPSLLWRGRNSARQSSQLGLSAVSAISGSVPFSMWATLNADPRRRLLRRISGQFARGEWGF
jgi:hypothetical protein